MRVLVARLFAHINRKPRVDSALVNVAVLALDLHFVTKKKTKKSAKIQRSLYYFEFLFYFLAELGITGVAASSTTNGCGIFSNFLCGTVRVCGPPHWRTLANKS